MKAGKRIIVGCAAALALVVAATALAFPSNGGFERGTLQGWKTFERGGGEWGVYDGAPPRGDGFPAPPRGQYAALVTQGEPGVNILHRKLKLRKNARNVLSFFLAYRNNADRFYTPRNFKHGVGDIPLPRGITPEKPNQQFRIDLMKPRAGIRSLGRRQVIANLYRTRRDDPSASGYRKLRFNLNKLGARGTVRLRIAEVDNVGPLNVGIDDVKLKRKRR